MSKENGSRQYVMRDGKKNFLVTTSDLAEIVTEAIAEERRLRIEDSDKYNADQATAMRKFYFWGALYTLSILALGFSLGRTI